MRRLRLSEYKARFRAGSRVSSPCQRPPLSVTGKMTRMREKTRKSGSSGGSGGGEGSGGGKGSGGRGRGSGGGGGGGGALISQEKVTQISTYCTYS